MSSRILITGGTLVPCDPGRPPTSSADILIEDGKILEIGPELVASDSQVISARDEWILPGLIDGHSHLWQQQLRNLGVNWALPDYQGVIRGTFGDLYRPEDTYAGTLLGAVERLASGVTCVVDCSHNMNSPEHADAVVQALMDSGIRAVLAYGSANSDWTPTEDWKTPTGTAASAQVTERGLSRDAYRMRSQYFSSSGGLVTMALNPRAVRGRGNYKALAADIAMARELDVPATFAFGRRPLHGNEPSQWEELHAAGLTGNHLYYHSDQLGDEDLAIIEETGGRVVFTPENELRAGYALAPYGKLVRRGLYPAIGIDTPVFASDYFNAMRAALASSGVLQRINALHQGTNDVASVDVTVQDIIECATVRGAAACWLGDRTGSLRAGKAADIITIDKRALTLTSVPDPMGAIVYNGHPAAVRTVLVAGRIIKLAGEVVGVDLGRVVRLAELSREYLFSGAPSGLAFAGE